MKVGLIKFVLAALAKLPLPVVHGISNALGALVWRLDWKQRATAVRNLQLCFPEETAEFHTKTARSGTLSMAQAVLELPRLFNTNNTEILAMLDNPEVLEELKSVYAKGNGLMIATPHLGSWEYIGQLLSAYTTMTCMFRPPRIPELTDWIRSARTTNGASLVPTDASGVRALTRVLANGHCSGILPDQEPDEGAGIFVPFFNIPTYTMTLLPRLVRKRKTPVAFLIAERLPKGKFRLVVQWAADELYNKDPSIACSCMNAHIESLIRAYPEQYNWPYRRFKLQPDGSAHYARASLKKLAKHC